MSKLGTNSGQDVDIQEIKDKVGKIAKEFRPEKIILFGSYAKERSTQGSDIDLLVIVNTKRSTLDVGAEISLFLRHSFPIDIIVRTPQDITKRLKQGDFFIKDIMENGIVLYERSSQ